VKWNCAPEPSSLSAHTAAAVGQDDVLDDGQAKPGAAGVARTRLVHAIEALEDTIEVLEAMPGPKS
jgi:hypothetical protein